MQLHNALIDNPIPLCLNSSQFLFLPCTYFSFPASHFQSPLLLSVSVCGWGVMCVLLTSLSTDLQRIRSPSNLPVITATLMPMVPIWITDAGDADCHVHQKATLPEESKRNIEAISPCMSDSLQLDVGLFVILAVCCLNHSWTWATNLAPGETQIITEGCVQTGDRVKFKFKYGCVVVFITFCCDISKVGNIEVT